jgi:hypothetical protein
MREVQILVDTANQFIAEQQPYGFNFFQITLIFGMVGAVAYAIRQGAWKTTLILVPVTVFLIWATWPHGVAYRMELKTQHRVLEVQTLRKDKIVASQTVKFSDIARAEMQFNRGDKRIVVVLNNGKEVFPLGDEYIQNEPNQYKPLIAIQKAVGLPLSNGPDK